MTGELPGGWTLEQVARIARWVVRHQRGLIIEREEATDLVATALIERIYSKPPATEDDLFHAAQHALSTANAREMSYKGYDVNASKTGKLTMPRGYATYWYGKTAMASPFEDKLVEKLAARQLWGGLSYRDQETLRTLMETGTNEAAQAALGITKSAWFTRLWRARLAGRTLWHYPEEPSKHWGRDHPGVKPPPRGRIGSLAVLARRRQERARKTAA